MFLRTEFASCSVLTIAHRLNTVTGKELLTRIYSLIVKPLGGDTVLVLDKGKLAEQVKQKKRKISLNIFTCIGFTRIPVG